MKTLRAGLLLAAAFSINALAFHSGGVAECNGCHTMHGSFENKIPEAYDPNSAVEGDEVVIGVGYRVWDAAANSGAGAWVSRPLQQYEAGPYLLKGSDPSSACLNCHAANDTAPTRYHIMTFPVPAAGTAPVELSPGGDFAWLSKTYSWSPRSGTTEWSHGERHGHNVVALDFGLTPDGTILKSPGGDFPADKLACSSCHDPHGKFRRVITGTTESVVNGAAEPTLPIRGSGSYNTSQLPVENIYAVGVYRILGGSGYQPKSAGAAPAFTSTVPSAVTHGTYNASEATQVRRVAYGTGMSEWCGNCHAKMHRDTYVSGGALQTHPAGSTGNAILPSFIVNNYNAYVKTGDLSRASATGAYSTLVPFEEGTGDFATLKALVDTNNQDGPNGGTENVQCLSCHRAHASAFDSMMRWSMAYEFMTDGDATGTPTFGDPAGAVGIKTAVAQGRTPLETETAYYGRTATQFAPFQRVLCNKCHAKD